jgi:hypothetical protein
MAIRVQITIQDEGFLDAIAFSQLIDRTERVSRNAAVIVLIRLGDELELPQSLMQLAIFRLSSGTDSLFLIKDITAGSKIVWGTIVAAAVIQTVLNNTIGESLKEGWRHTRTHGLVTHAVPRIEELFLSELGGCGCLNRISASISGASAGVRPPRGKAAS